MRIFSVDILPDILGPNLKVVFCGVAAGNVSARKGVYYGGPGNAFWKTLFEVELTPFRFEPSQFRNAIDYRIGLTDIVKSEFGRDHELPAGGHEPDRLLKVIRQLQPRALAFNGKKSASLFYGLRTNRIRTGRQLNDIGKTAVFVLPSTSGAARGYWVSLHWHELAEFLSEGPDP